MERRKLLKEAVNEIQLDDIYSAASKLEQQAISLAEMSIKFSDRNVKQQALLLKKQAGVFTEIISDILTSEVEGRDTLRNVEDDIDFNDNEGEGEDEEMNESQGGVINLTEAFKYENDLTRFKRKLYKALYESKVKDVDYQQIKSLRTVEKVNRFLNEIYDKASENNFKVKF